jgi:uncharacterized protein DUF5667
VNTLMHRRHAERFAQLLDEADGARTRHHSRSALDEELADLVAFGHALSDAAPEVTMRTSARLEIRAHIMATAAREGIGATAKPSVGRASVGDATAATPGRRPLRQRIRTRGAVLVGLAVGTLALSGIAAASGDAMPGNPLYGVKRSQENAQLVLAGSPVAKGNVYLELARIRLGEAEGVHNNSRLLLGALHDMDAETQSGSSLLLTYALSHRDTRTLDSVDAFVEVQNRHLQTLLNEIGGGANRHDVLESRFVLTHVQQRVTDVRASLACHSTAVSRTDHYGPVPKVTSCDESTPVHTPGGTHGPSTGPTSAPSSGHAAGGHSSPAPAGAGVDATAGANVGADTAVTAPPTGADGLLGDIGHLLGGLLG